MAADHTASILTQFMGLVANGIDLIATKAQSRPATQGTVAEVLHGLSIAARKSISDFTENLQSLSETDRETILSTLEKSGVVNTMSLLIPPLEMGHAAAPASGILPPLSDTCFWEHEAAKIFYAAANISEYVWPVAAGMKLPNWVAAGLETLGLIADIAAQACSQLAADAADVKLNAMEDAVVRIEQKINYIMDLPDGVATPTVPKDTQPVSLTALEKMLEVTKKFYKFEDIFKPTFQKDKQLIMIAPPATAPPPPLPIPLLVTGFIDLGAMQDNDVVTITTKVLEPIPSPHYVIWRVKTFTGHQSHGLKHFEDFADLLEVPGDGVEVLIAQSASAHNFDPAFPLTIPYQFLVESTALPQFIVS
jgi:hypothetical protein